MVKEWKAQLKAEDQHNLGYLISALNAAVTDKNVRATVLLWGMSAVGTETIRNLTMDKMHNNEKSLG